MRSKIITDSDHVFFTYKVTNGNGSSPKLLAGKCWAIRKQDPQKMTKFFVSKEAAKLEEWQDTDVDMAA